MARWMLYTLYIDNTPGVNEMSAYDSFLDAEYDAYCEARDEAERDFLQEEITELQLQARDSWACIQFSQIELGKAMDLRDDDAARVAHEAIEYETALLDGVEAEILRLEEELAYLRC